MKRIFRNGLMLVAVLAFAASPSAWATCNLDTQIIGNTLGGWIENCPDANPIKGYAWLLSSPATVNSNGQEFVCRSDDQNIPDSGVSCTAMPGSGVAGDGKVTIYIEYGTQNAGIIGCPNQAQTAVDNPMGVQITCNNGATALFTLGYFFDSQQYIVDVAGPADGSMIQASFANGPQITSVGAGPSPSASTVCVNVPLPTVNDDCNPATLGGGLTCGGARPAPTRGILMTTNGPCGTNPDLRAANWTATPVPLDAAGNACNTLSPPTGSCAYLGVQGQWGAVNSGGITGWVAVGGPSASSDKVKIDSATTTQGKVKVAFSTTNETSIVGFNVYSDGAKLNSSLIASKGVGNNAYSFEIGRGALKGGKSVLVEAVKKDGTVEKTAPVSLK